MKSIVVTRFAVVVSFIALVYLLIVAFGIYSKWSEPDVSFWKRVVAQKPGDMKSLLFLAYALEDANDITEAQNTLLKALSVNPNSYAAHYELGKILNQLGDRPAAYRHWRFVLAHAEKGKSNSAKSWVKKVRQTMQSDPES